MEAHATLALDLGTRTGWALRHPDGRVEFGTAIFAQAFVIAFRIPNLLRDLVGEGAANSAFVPVLTDELTKKGKKDSPINPVSSLTRRNRDFPNPAPSITRHNRDDNPGPKGNTVESLDKKNTSNLHFQRKGILKS